MSLLKPLFGFLFRFLLLYALLLAPWPGLAESYAHIFRIVGESLFGTVGSKGMVRFTPLAEPQIGINYKLDTEILYANRDLITDDMRRAHAKIPLGASRFSSWYSGYLPTVVVIALILATPMTRSRKGWALLWGLILVHGFILGSLFIHLLAGFNQSKGLGLVVLTPFWENVLLSLHKILINNITPKYVIAIFIWMMVVLRRNEWMTLGEKFNLLKADNNLKGCKLILHSFIKPPSWVVARQLSDGTMQLSWEGVDNATGYQVYRQQPDEDKLRLYQSVPNAVTFTKDKTMTSQPSFYAVASVGFINNHKTVSVLSEKITAVEG